MRLIVNLSVRLQGEIYSHSQPFLYGALPPAPIDQRSYPHHESRKTPPTNHIFIAGNPVQESITIEVFVRERTVCRVKIPGRLRYALSMGGYMSRKYALAILLGFLAISLFAQDFYDMGTVNNIQLFFTQTNWDQILDQLYAAGEDRLLGSAIINGVAYDSVGVRYKGNSSYGANRNKNPFNIKLNHIINDQTIGPYGTIKLANGFSDPSFIRETLSYEIA